MSKEFIELEQPFLTNNYTTVMVEKEYKFNAPHHFKVVKTDNPDEVVGEINFQEGPIKEVGVNGVNNEDLISMVIARLTAFQDSEYACEENKEAALALYKALAYLRDRTLKRKERGVEGTSTV